MEETECMLAQLFCQSHASAQQMIIGAKESVRNRLATAMDPIDLVIEAIKMDALPVSVRVHLKSIDVGALISVATSHSGTFARVSEQMFYTPGMELLLRRLARVRPPMDGYTIADWLDMAVYGRAPGEASHGLRVYGASPALRSAMTGSPRGAFV